MSKEESTTSGVSMIRQNFHEESEKALNQQINMSLTASYIYESMAWYFERDDVALKGFFAFFCHNSNWDRNEHAERLMKYMNNRGGIVNLQNVEKPTKDEWGSGLEAMQAALECEKKINASFLKLHDIAQKNNDSHFTHFLEDNFLDQQVKWIRVIGCYITQLNRVGSGIGEYLFDKELFVKYATTVPSETAKKAVFPEYFTLKSIF